MRRELNTPRYCEFCGSALNSDSLCDQCDYDESEFCSDCGAQLNAGGLCKTCEVDDDVYVSASGFYRDSRGRLSYTGSRPPSSRDRKDNPINQAFTKIGQGILYIVWAPLALGLGLVWIALGLAVPVAAILIILAFVGVIGGEGENEAVEEYTAEVSAALDGVVDSQDRFLQIASTDFSTMNRNQATGAIREFLDVGTELRAELTAAESKLNDITAPERCVNAHVSMIESIQTLGLGLDFLLPTLSDVLVGRALDSNAYERGMRLIVID